MFKPLQLLKTLRRSLGRALRAWSDRLLDAGGSRQGRGEPQAAVGGDDGYAVPPPGDGPPAHWLELLRGRDPAAGDGGDAEPDRADPPRGMAIHYRADRPADRPARRPPTPRREFIPDSAEPRAAPANDDRAGDPEPRVSAVLPTRPPDRAAPERRAPPPATVPAAVRSLPSADADGADTGRRADDGRQSDSPTDATHARTATAPPATSSDSPPVRGRRDGETGGGGPVVKSPRPAAAGSNPPGPAEPPAARLRRAADPARPVLPAPSIPPRRPSYDDSPPARSLAADRSLRSQPATESRSANTPASAVSNSATTARADADAASPSAARAADRSGRRSFFRPVRDFLARLAGARGTPVPAERRPLPPAEPRDTTEPPAAARRAPEPPPRRAVPVFTDDGAGDDPARGPQRATQGGVADRVSSPVTRAPAPRLSWPALADDEAIDLGRQWPSLPVDAIRPAASRSPDGSRSSAATAHRERLEREQRGEVWNA